MQVNKNIGWLYCYMRGSKAVFLNRWDETIKEFESYDEANDYANKNSDLINIKINPSTQKTTSEV